MMAEKKPHYSGERVTLSDVIPLEMPFSIQCEPSQYCNLKCKYCVQSFGVIKDRHIMSQTTFRILCSQVKEFGGKLKTFNFAGWGEPLLNPGLSEMIRIIVKEGITEKIAIITNGVSLNRDLSLELIKSGVNHIRISLQGLSGEAYEKISKKHLDFPEFLKRIKFLYLVKRECRLSIKIADIALSAGEETRFYEMFDKICDDMYVEHIRPMFSQSPQDDKLESKYGFDHPPISVCPQPFFMLSITAFGDIFPCCSYYNPTRFGNVYNRSLFDVWHSDDMKHFYRNLLNGCRKEITPFPVCSACLMPDAVITPGDELDDKVAEILERL